MIKKYKIAAKHLPEYCDSLDKLEAAIVERYGEETLAEWKRQEAEFKRKVVDPSQHANLGNPYDLDTDVPGEHQAEIVSGRKSNPWPSGHAGPTR